MKKGIRLGFLVLALFFIIGVGCDRQISSNKPYINSITPDKSFGSEGETVNVVVSVQNPAKVNYNGKVLIQADIPECFGMTAVEDGGQKQIKGYLEPISVLAGATNSALIKMKIPLENQENCYKPTTNHMLTFFILQEGQINKLEILDSKNLDFSLFRKED